MSVICTPRNATALLEQTTVSNLSQQGRYWNTKARWHRFLHAWDILSQFSHHVLKMSAKTAHTQWVHFRFMSVKLALHNSSDNSRDADKLRGIMEDDRISENLRRELSITGNVP